ncbi:DHHW family protein [Zongyangia hominis]|uniref:DHHW protein n=1 Tax=Zongyangia hominis TaxID=2763677 RepID=A0A926EFA8_9FIRM|nr:DHHW family protein [Zongyangia hominis]MBC8570791.1 hypothetical protein [Zongyangia hominis]
MKPKRIAAIILLIMMFVLPTYVVMGTNRFWRDMPLPTWETLADHSYMTELGNYVSGQFAKNELLSQTKTTLKYYTGVREENGVYIGKNRLIKDMEEPNEEKLNANISALNQFVSGKRADAFLVLLPTSAAINQEEIPKYAVSVNQKNIIDNVYNQVGENIRTIDAYSALFARREEYLYYRTDDRLTIGGAYVVYGAMIEKMGHYRRNIESFDVEHVRSDYFGPLYPLTDFRNIQPDRISLYHYTRYGREYQIKVYGADGVAQSDTPYLTQWLDTDNPDMVYLGAGQIMTKIHMEESPYKEKLLILGDDNAYKLGEFLQLHYQDITIVNTARIMELPEDLALDEYDKIVLIFDVDTFTHTYQPFDLGSLS